MTSLNRTSRADRAVVLRGPRAQAWRWLRGVGLLIVTVVTVEYAAVHLLARAQASWVSVGSASPWVLVLALAAELASLACFSRLTLVLLPGVVRPRYGTVLAIDITGNGLSHVVPGGGATAAAVRFRLLNRVKVPFAEAVSAATLESAVTVLWLVVGFVLGLMIAVPHPETGAFLKAASVVVVVLVILFGALIAVLVARPDLLVSVTHALARRLPLVSQQALERFVRTVTRQVHIVLTDSDRRRPAILWALAYWALDALSLFLCVLAFGAAPNVGGLITTYTLVSLLALLPITPGGLGLVEGVAVPLLVSFDTSHGSALLGVLTWRLFGFWLPIPLALVAYLGLRLVVRPDREGQGR